MTVRVYADAATYREYSGVEGPADIDARLARASRYLDVHVLLTAVYRVDAAGMPTDQGVAEAIGRAACAQVAYWLENGTEDGSAAGYASVTIGRVSLTRSPGADSDTSRTAPAVVDELAGVAGLTLGAVWTGDAWTCLPS